MSEQIYITDPDTLEPWLDDIAIAYQKAFAGEPWNEVSQCEDTETQKRCTGGFSALEIGQTCDNCQQLITTPAYPPSETKKDFRKLTEIKEAVWYLELDDGRLALAALAWASNPTEIGEEKYKDNPEMQDWLEKNVEDTNIVYLSEVFASGARDKGNLNEFGAWVNAMCNEFDSGLMVYRTVNPRMIRAAERDFGSRATIFCRNRIVPDRRDLVIVNVKGD